MNMSAKDATDQLQSARQVYAVGPRAIDTRPASRLIVNAFKLGVVVALGVAAWNMATSSDDASTLTASKTQNAASSAKASSGSARTQAFDGNAAIISQLPERAASAPLTAPVPNNIPGAAYPLAIDVKPTDSTPALAVKMWRAGQEFQAAALQAEGLETRPYYIEGDPTQPTIGVGYNIKMSATAIGREGVRRELQRAGIDANTINTLMSSDQKVSSQAQISVSQALALLDIATHRFRDSTRAAVGASTYDRLPEHRQAALMWIDYNSNLHARPSLVSAVRQGKTQEAINQMETWITVHGKKIRSPNIVLAQAMYWNEDGMKQVVMNPSLVKKKSELEQLPWQTPAPVAVQSSEPASELTAVPSAASKPSPLSNFQNVRPAQSSPAPAPAASVASSGSEPVVIPDNGEMSEEVKNAVAARRAWLQNNGYRAVDAGSTPAPASPSPQR